eukprot:1766820-Pyramimonas_sp.AAC.1
MQAGEVTRSPARSAWRCAAHQGCGGPGSSARHLGHRKSVAAVVGAAAASATPAPGCASGKIFGGLETGVNADGGQSGRQILQGPAKTPSG